MPLQEMYTPQDIKGQTQTIPGKEKEMEPRPIYDDKSSKGYGRLTGKTAIVTGGDSGIGRAVSVAYAKEGANVAIIYNKSDEDANETKEIINQYGGNVLLIKGNIKDAIFCRDAVERIIYQFGGLDILVNNAGEQHPQKQFEDITEEQLDDTFRTNIYAMFYLTKAAMPYLKEGSAIINTGSVTAFKGHAELVDYAAAKGAVTAFTRSLSLNLANKKIRVNQVAPGPIWTPLIPSTFTKEQVDTFGADTPYKRAGQPVELAEAYIFLATNGSNYMTGQTIHINGGHVVNG